MKKPEEYTISELQLLKLYDEYQFARVREQQSLDFQKKLQDLTMRMTKAQGRMHELNTEYLKQSLLPHRMYGCEIFYVPSEGVYYCKLPSGAEEDEEIFAVGDTAAQACDNFDHLWVHGQLRGDIE